MKSIFRSLTQVLGLEYNCLIDLEGIWLRKCLLQVYRAPSFIKTTTPLKVLGPTHTD